MSIKFINNWATELTAPMPADGESLEVEAAEIAKLEGLAAGEEYRVTLTDDVRSEVVSVRRVVSGGPLVVVRGVEGTEPRDWPAFTKVFSGVTAGILDELSAAPFAVKAVSGELVDVLSSDHSVVVDLTGDVVVTLPPSVKGSLLRVMCIQDAVGAHGITWPESVMWQGGSGAHGSEPDQVTVFNLYGAQAGRWVGSADIYSNEGGEVPVEKAGVYAFAWRDVDDVVTLALFGDDQTALHSATVSTASSDNDETMLVVSPDASVVVFCPGYGELTLAYDTETWTSVELDAPVGRMSFAKYQPTIVDGYLYSIAEGSGVYRTSLTTGVREDLSVQLNGAPQSISAAGSELTLTYNQTTSNGELVTVPLATFDLATLALTPTQFALPAGADFPEPNTGQPSPYGLGGCYSSDGLLYAISSQLTYAEHPEGISELHVYDAVTREVLNSYAFASNSSGMKHSPVWSPNDRYCAVFLDYGAVLVADLESDTSVEITLPSHDGPEYLSSLIITNDGHLVMRTPERFEPKPFVTLSIATGVVVADWGDGSYGAVVDYSGILLASN